MSSYAEGLPWFVDNEGKPLDLEKPINIFEGVSIVSRYLEYRKQLNLEESDMGKLSTLLQPFIDENDSETINAKN